MAPFELLYLSLILSMFTAVGCLMTRPVMLKGLGIVLGLLTLFAWVGLSLGVQ